MNMDLLDKLMENNYTHDGSQVIFIAFFKFWKLAANV
jgi:hypothetical protein